MFCLVGCMLVQLGLAGELEGDPESWSAQEYNDWFNAESIEGMAEIKAAQARPLTGERGELEKHMADVRAITEKRRARFASVPGFQGDTSFRDTVVGVYDEVLKLYDNEMTELLHLRFAPTPTQADVRRASTLLRQSEKKVRSLIGDINKAQTKFIESQGHVAVDLEVSDPPPEKQFEADGVPPKGVDLPTNLFMAMTNNYTVAHQIHLDAVVSVVNECIVLDVQADTDAYAACAQKMATTCQTAKTQTETLEPSWFGESSLHDGTIGAADSCLKSSQLMTGIAQLVGGGLKTQEEVDRVNAQIDELSAESKRLNPLIDEAAVAWRARWHFDGYNAFVKARR